MESESTAWLRRFPRVAGNDPARAWLIWQLNRGLASNTLEAYGRGLEKYLAFLRDRAVTIETASRLDIATYVRNLLPRSIVGQELDKNCTNKAVANATLQQRVTVIRLFHDYLVEEGIQDRNPVRQGLPGTTRFANHSLVRRYHRLPWIPTDDEWQAVLNAARSEAIRNRMMLALSYDCALRREELCGLQAGDVDPAYRLIRIRAKCTKGRRERVVPYSRIDRRTVHSLCCASSADNPRARSAIRIRVAAQLGSARIHLDLVQSHSRYS
jgi:integrase/recombinase XerD